jgi:hypothetical protein
MFVTRYSLPQYVPLHQAAQAYMENKQDDNDNKDDDDDDIFASGFHSTESSINSKLLAPFPGKLGCGLNLEAVLSTMQIYDLDNDPEERFLV